MEAAAITPRLKEWLRVLVVLTSVWLLLLATHANLAAPGQPVNGGCAGGALGGPHNQPGALCEDFDTDRNGSGLIEWSRLFTTANPADPLDAFAVCGDDDLLGGSAGGSPAPLGVDGRMCSEDAPFPAAQGACRVVPSENDWHIHTALEGCDDTHDARPQFDSTCAPVPRAHSGFRSLHMGRHVAASD